MEIQTLFFGMAKDLAGQAKVSFSLDKETSVKDFRDFLKREYPSFSNMDSFSIAVNESYADDELVLEDRDTVAIIPPVSGG